MHILEERIRAEGIETTKIEINASTKSIEVGESKILTATILQSNATDKKSHGNQAGYDGYRKFGRVRLS